MYTTNLLITFLNLPILPLKNWPGLCHVTQAYQGRRIQLSISPIDLNYCISSFIKKVQTITTLFNLCWFSYPFFCDQTSKGAVKIKLFQCSLLGSVSVDYREGGVVVLFLFLIMKFCEFYTTNLILSWNSNIIELQANVFTIISKTIIWSAWIYIHR